MLTGNSKRMNGMHDNDKRSTSCVQSKSNSKKRSKLRDLIDDYMSTNVLNRIQPKDYTERDQDTRIDLDANEVNESNNDGDTYMYAYEKVSGDQLPIYQYQYNSNDLDVHTNDLVGNDLDRRSSGK